jgi:hypothetical protein
MYTALIPDIKIPKKRADQPPPVLYILIEVPATISRKPEFRQVWHTYRFVEMAKAAFLFIKGEGIKKSS